MLEITRKDVKLDIEQFEQETIYREQRVTALKMFCWITCLQRLIRIYDECDPFQDPDKGKLFS